MHSAFKLSMLTLGMISLIGCDSDNGSNMDPEFALQRHLQTTDAFDLRVNDGDLLVTATDNQLYRLAANDDEWELLVSNGGSYNFILTPGSEYYALLSDRLERIRLSTDAGANWTIAEGITLPPTDVYSAMLLIGSDIYLHAGEGLDRTSLDTSRDDGGLQQPEVLHQSNTAERFRFENRVRALVYNEARNELWWNEFYREDDADYRVMRIDLETDEVEQVFSHDTNPLMDGFVDDTDPNTVVFAGEGGVRISHDNGSTWTRHYLQEEIQPTVFSVQQDLVSLNYYAYASVMIDGVRTDEMWCSSDQGASWHRTWLAEGSSGIRNTTNSMVFLDRDGIRYFFIPTFGGIIQGALDDVTC